jgi:hypothetical protein
MRTTPGFALREVREAFRHLIQQMQRMHGDCQVKPSDSNVIQSVGGRGNDVTLQCGPVVCRVPERASHGSATLYVVFTGSITFNPERTDEHLVTARYGTNFAYFGVDTAGADHVLGGHYDFSPAQVAHPRAHLQLRSQADMYPHAQSNFRSIVDVPLRIDRMKNVLNRVRPPSAQMDFLSFRSVLIISSTRSRPLKSCLCSRCSRHHARQYWAITRT